MEKENKNMNNFDIDALTDEELEQYLKSIIDARGKRRKAQQEKELAERRRQEEELRARRKERAKEVEEAFKVVYEKQKEADSLMKAFIRDYGYFHATISQKKDSPSLWDIIF